MKKFSLQALQLAGSVTEVFSLDNPSAIVTSFESPIRDYISRITTTSDVIWLDDRFRRRPLLSFKHYRSFDRTLRVLTANLAGGTFLSFPGESALISIPSLVLTIDVTQKQLRYPV